jgi:hypothetical protein
LCGDARLGCSEGQVLVSETPATSRTRQEWLAEVRRYERDGELFRAYDLARQGLEQYPDDLQLKHRAVLCLASSGAWHRAAAEIAELGLYREEPLPLATQLGLDIAALRPRLLKDEALATAGEGRAGAFGKAAAAYADVYRRARQAGNPEAYYPGVNAASLYLISGDAAGAAAIAREVLETLQHWPQENTY